MLDSDVAVVTGKVVDFAEVIVGGTPSTKEPSYWGGDIVWVTPTDVTGARGAVLSDSARCITPEGVANSSARLVPAGSILVTTRATIGPAVIAGCELATNQGVTALVAGEKLASRWLFYWVLANRREFVSRGVGNTFPEISRTKTRAIPMSVPRLEEQRRIADMLAAVDAHREALLDHLEDSDRLRGTLLASFYKGVHSMPPSYDRFLADGDSA